MATDVVRDLSLRSLQRDDQRSLSEWTTTFQLFVVALDPYTQESATILPTATKLLREYAEADCRTAFLMACGADDAQRFLGPVVEELMVFVDPERVAIKTLGLTSLPAMIHIDQSPAVVNAAEGWNPVAWREVASNLSKVLGWTPPGPTTADEPPPFAGTPV